MLDQVSVGGADSFLQRTSFLSCVFLPLPILSDTVSKGTCCNYRFLESGFKIIPI